MHTTHPTEDEFIRRRVRLIALGVITFLGVMACGYVALPFLPAMTWAVALAVMTYPLHHRLAQVVSNGWAAGITTLLVIAILILPLIFVGGQLGQEAARASELFQSGQIEAALERVPRGQEAVSWVRHNVDFVEMASNLTDGLTGNVAAFASGSAWVAIQALMCAIILFFVLRDRGHLLVAAGDLSPLSPAEADHLATRVSDAVHATVYATVVTGVVQGATGGLLFWALGLPGAVLWGVVMVILGILPVLGAFLVWVPAAVVLAVGDRWGAALILVSWGLLMAGPVNNWLYARLAGGRTKLHPMPVLIAFVGGLAAFGISGMVLGPVILAVTLGLLDVWRWRFKSGPPRVVVPDAPPK